MKRTIFFGWICFFLCSCSLTTGTFEKSISLPDHQWPSSLKPDIEFTITDTLSLYNIYIVLRHTDAYHYNNLYVRAMVKEPGENHPKTGDYDLLLATNEKGWTGTAMDDIYDTRIIIQPKTRFSKTGSYHFIMEQLMREDPLKNILSVGLRLEKIP
ncbi:MAG: gliding motility lipoprotein GldH [Bacteroidota bacterium]|nr:gliding motility lipoprotein GldH [Bacteroidota bacterium]MDP4212792.1 gliding motility lipoprotein GldH [Bacteroidota bacterium]MDP4250232.1 gliding motility lipoprotein GldH [Bacteroidota bacterium]